MRRLWRLGKGLRVAAMSKKCKLDRGQPGSAAVSAPVDSSGQVPPEETFFRLPPPHKSPSDKKEYSTIRLRNGLTALLVTDLPLPEADDVGSVGGERTETNEVESVSSEGSDVDEEQKISACALCVGVGSLSDPAEVPGMAHFLEHMVFMGSEKFPAENEFDAFIKRKGGSDNASTQCEHTTFYFECQEEHLKEAMDIFSQFFKAPLMKYEAMTRERQAIESEFNMALPSDTYRRTQLLCSLAHSDNPLGKFSWGNLKTLRDNVEDKRLHEQVHEFRRRHYSGHRMTLAVQARLPQDVLASWVQESFSKVPSNNLDGKRWPLQEEPFPLDRFNRLYYVEPVNDICEVELTWALPPLQHLYRKKPLEYVSWLLGHEGRGGLLSRLRKKVWALGIVAGEVDDAGSNSLLSLLSLKIELSEEGYTNLEGCLDDTFSYIKLLQDTGPVERIFNEIKQVSDNNFRYYDEVSPVENVESLAESMQLYPPEHYISGSELHFEYDPEEIKRILNLITPDRVNIMVSSKKLLQEHTLDQTEKWFGTKYTSKEIPLGWSEDWKLGKKSGEFHLPEPNVYIPDNFTILTAEGENATAKYPRKIVSNSTMELWYKQDVKFKLPQAYMYFYLVSPEHASAPLQRAMVDMFTAALGQLLIEDAYPAVVAEMGYEITCVERGIIICVYGFDQNLHLLLDKITEGIHKFRDNLTMELFDAIKKLQHRYYTNMNLKAGMLAKELRMSTILDVYWPITDKLKVVPDITHEALKEFGQKYFDSMYVQGLIQGNISENRAKEIAAKLTEKLVKHSLAKKPEVRVRKIEQGQTNIRANSFNSEDTNCITTTYFQYGPGTIKDYCILEILLMLLEEPLFDTLRTQEQLGYDVSCRLVDAYGILGFTITVVSQRDKVTVDHVEERIKAFLETSLERFKNIPREEFDEAVFAIIKLKQYSDVHLKEEVQRNWREIKNDEYVFDRLDREVDLLQEIEPKQIHEFLVNMLSPKGRLLLVQVVSDKDLVVDTSNLTTVNFQNPPVSKSGQVYITDPPSYKQQLLVYPLSKLDK